MPIPLREERTNVFIGNEGESELIFAKHLVSLYSKGKIQVTKKFAGGKCPEFIVNKSNDQRRDRSVFQWSIILIDTDKCLEEAIVLAKQYGFELIRSTPCLEGLLLKILGESVPSLSRDCKEVFQRKYNGGQELLREDTCLRHFHKDVLESARRRIVDPLDILIRRLSGDFF